MTKEAKQIFTRRITQANSSQLVVILYDMAITYMDDAAAAYDAGCGQELKKALQCARNCIAELRNSLNFSYDLSKNLFAVYAFADRELANDMCSMKTEHIVEIRQIFTKLRGAFNTVSKEDHTAPLMQNAQDIYAGVTYGRSGINESVLYGSARRGFCI